jgi:hypothetical protein
VIKPTAAKTGTNDPVKNWSSVPGKTHQIIVVFDAFLFFCHGQQDIEQKLNDCHCE